jgi:MFS family permease
LKWIEFMNPLSGLRGRGRSFIGRLSPGVWFITITGFLNSAAFSISLPFIAIYLFDDRHISMTVVGLIILLGGVASAAVQLYAGALADRLGRRPLLIASVVAAGVFYLIMAFMVGLTAPVWIIVVVYTLVRSALMMQRPAIQAMVVDLCPREKLVEANGVLRVGQNLGWAFGPAIGGYLLVSISYSWLFGVAAFISLAIIFFVWSSIKETCHVIEEQITLAGIFAATRNRSFLIFVILCIILFLSMGQMGSTLSVFAVDRAHFTLEQYGSLLTLNGLIVVAFQYPVARLIARLRHSTALVFGSLLYALGWSLMGFVGSYALAIASMSVLTMGEIIIAPTSLAVVGVHAPAGKRGRYQGFFGISETLGVAIGPFMGGVLLDVFPRSNFFIWSVISAFAVLAAIGFGLWGRLFSRTRA